MRDDGEGGEVIHSLVEYLRNGRSAQCIRAVYYSAPPAGVQRRGTVLVHYQWALIPAAASHYRVAR